MISCLTYSFPEQELEELKEIMKDEAAYASGEEWIWNFFARCKDLETFLEENPLLDMACLDIRDKFVLNQLSDIRKRYQKSMMMVIADTSISPMSYLKPSVMPNSLLLRPASQEQIHQVVKELFETYVREHEESNPDNIFVVDTREGRTFIPYSQILFFEAREKKVFVRAGTSEYALYDTLENINNQVPEIFLRCHRSYIINKEHIQKVQLSKNQIEMADGVIIPVSRSYRMDVKNL